MLFYDSGFQPVLYQLFCIPLCGFSVYFVVFRKEIGKGVGIEICSFHMLPKAGCRRVQADDIAEIYVSRTSFLILLSSSTTNIFALSILFPSGSVLL